jgi:Co/Zn/Cd efflux system component
MAHHQKAVAAATALNTGIFLVERIAGYQSGSLSLIMDSIHNFSDELASYSCIWLSFSPKASLAIFSAPPTSLTQSA